MAIIVVNTSTIVVSYLFLSCIANIAIVALCAALALNSDGLQFLIHITSTMFYIVVRLTSFNVQNDLANKLSYRYVCH